MTMRITLDKKTMDLISIEEIDKEEVSARQIAEVIAPEIEELLQTKENQAIIA